MEKALNYQDIYLVPKYTDVVSRSLVDTSVDFLGKRWRLPVVPANMAGSMSVDWAKFCSENDYFYVMHRFGKTGDFVAKASEENWKTVSISVGVKDEDKNLIDWISGGVKFPEIFKRRQLKLDYVTIDIAHGHCQAMKEMISFIRSYLPDVKIIAGNVATPEAVYQLATWGADAVKVGIAGGGVCSTKIQTGFHVPMFTCIKNCFQFGNGRNVTMGRLDGNGMPSENAKIPIIADGGVKNNGDIAKAIRAGAAMVMAGSIFAACIDSPAENIYSEMMSIDPNRPIPPVSGKKFYGSASQKNKSATNQQVRNVEGFEVELACNNMTLEQKLLEIQQSLQSSCSYAGSGDLSGLRVVDYVTVK